MNPLGRTTDAEIRPQAIDQICKVILEMGLFPVQAAAMCGIGARTFTRYLEQARAGNERYTWILDKVERAEAELSAKQLKEIRAVSIASKNSGTIEKIHGKRHRKLWGDKIEVSVMDDESALRMIEIVARVCGAENAERVIREFVSTSVRAMAPSQDAG